MDKQDLEKALTYFKARVQAMQAEQYLEAVDTIIALKGECKSNAAFTKALEEAGFTEEILPRNERSCITGWFADLDIDQRKRVVEWMKGREEAGETFRLQTAERHFAKMFNDEDEAEESAKKPRQSQPTSNDDEEDDEETAEQLQKSLADLKARYIELEQKLAIIKAKDSQLVQENKQLKARIKELEALVKEHVTDAMEEAAKF